MEGYLEIFGRKFCGKKGNFGLWRKKLFLGSGNTGFTPRPFCAKTCQDLPRPQSLSKGGEETEKKLFVGRAKKNSLLGARRITAIMHCPAMISQPPTSSPGSSSYMAREK